MLGWLHFGIKISLSSFNAVTHIVISTASTHTVYLVSVRAHACSSVKTYSVFSVEIRLVSEDESSLEIAACRS